MQLSNQDFIKAILLKESFEHCENIRATLLPLYEQHAGSYVNMLTVTMMLINESVDKSIVPCLEHIVKKFGKVIDIIEEYGIKLPEEEVQLEQIVKMIVEDGESAGATASTAPTNVVAGIDPATPRIHRNKKLPDDVNVDVISRKQ